MPASVADLVKKYAQVGLTLKKPEEYEVQKLAEVLKQFSQEQVVDLVARADHLPVLCSYINDGTPLTAKIRFQPGFDNMKVYREGGDDEELLVQRAMYRFVDGAGASHTAVQMRDPLPLRHGKTGDAIFAASLAFFKTLRQMGHKGIAVQHYAFDRSLHGFMLRRFRQHHSMYAKEGREEQLHGCPHLYDPAFLEWVVDTPCCNHDVHNAFKWSLFDYMANEELLKDMWAVAESHSQWLWRHSRIARSFPCCASALCWPRGALRHCGCHIMLGGIGGQSQHV